MSTLNKVDRVLIGVGTNSAATTLQTIAKGDLFLMKEDGTILTTAVLAAAVPKYEKVSVVMGTGAGKFIKSSTIQGNTVAKYTGTPYAAPVEQVTYLGYNGTSGNISVTAEQEYSLKVLIKDNLRTYEQRQSTIQASYVAGPFDTAFQVISGISKMFYQKSYGHSANSGYVILDRIVKGTATPFAVITTNVVKGSKIVTTSAANTVAVGDVLRIGGTTDTSPIYVVESVQSSTSFTLDTPYQGTTATIAPANILKMTALLNFGFKLTSLAQEPDVFFSDNSFYGKKMWVVFDASFSEVDATVLNPFSALVTTTAKPFPGQGEWKQVSAIEEKAKGYLGSLNKRSWDSNKIKSNVAVGTNYSAVQIESYDTFEGDFQTEAKAPVLTHIFVPTTSAQATNTGTNFLAILNGYFSTVVGFPTIPSM